MVHDASGPQVRRLDFRDGVTASIYQIRGQNVRAGENIMERTRLGRRVQSEYLHIRYNIMLYVNIIRYSVISVTRSRVIFSDTIGPFDFFLS